MSCVYGLIGKKLTHSYSSLIHEIILKSLNVKGTYNHFEVEEENLEMALKGLIALEARGVNVTIPYKIDVMQYLDFVSPEALKIGAVNTISFKEGRLYGYNTDYSGFGASLRNFSVDIKNKNAIILGTGGASKAVAAYLADNGILEMTYVTRDKEKTKEKEECLHKQYGFPIISYEELQEVKNKDLIINCTPCGMYPKVMDAPVNNEVLKEFSTAVDLIYNPYETVFLKIAKEQGLKTVNGLYMLVSQAVASQEIWQNIKIDEKAVLEIYNNIKGIIFDRKTGENI